MTLLKNLSLFTLFITLNSCNNNSFSSETETYKIEFKKAAYSQHNFTNHFQQTPLSINAERITLKEIFGILIKSDTSNIKFDDKKLQNENYNLLVKQKNQNIPVNKLVLNKIMSELNLKLVVNRYQSFNITIEDSLKCSYFISKSRNETSSFTTSYDSVKINNCDLNILTEVLNSEFTEKTTCNFNSKRIDYQWKKSSFEKLKLKMKNDLGINFSNTNNDRIVYTIKNN